MRKIIFTSFLLFTFTIQNNFCQGIKVDADKYIIDDVITISIKNKSCFKKKILLFSENIASEIKRGEYKAVNFELFEEIEDTIVLSLYDPLNGKYSSLEEAKDSLKLKTVSSNKNAQIGKEVIYIFSDRNKIMIKPFSKLIIKARFPDNFKGKNLKLMLFEIYLSEGMFFRLKEHNFSFKIE